VIRTGPLKGLSRQGFEVSSITDVDVSAKEELGNWAWCFIKGP
jgi:hypothetical protein